MLPADTGPATHRKHVHSSRGTPHRQLSELRPSHRRRAQARPSTHTPARFGGRARTNPPGSTAPGTHVRVSARTHRLPTRMWGKRRKTDQNRKGEGGKNPALGVPPHQPAHGVSPRVGEVRGAPRAPRTPQLPGQRFPLRVKHKKTRQNQKVSRQRPAPAARFGFT